MTKNIFKIIVVFVVGLIGGIFADQILWPYFIERPLFLEYRLDQDPIYVTEEIFVQENKALQETIEKVDEIVVGIKSETQAGKIIEGSGLIITSDGLIVTLSDLLPSGSETLVSFNGKEYSPEFIQLSDGIALIKIEEERLPTSDFLDFNQLKIGKRVFLLGAIFEKNKVKKIVNDGIIRYLDEEYIYTNIDEKEARGSVLFDIEGNVIGLNDLNKNGEVISFSISEIRKEFGF